MNEDASRRLFVALPIPPGVRDEVSAAIGRVAAHCGPGLRWVRPEAWHLTLTFLGSVPTRPAADVTTRLGRAAARAQPLELSISGFGRFGRQVLWAGLAGDVEALSRLASATSAAARRAGVRVDDRPYRPHLTIARGSPGADLRAALATLGELQTASWVADELHLMHSRLGAGPGGSAQHDVVARWPLTRRDAR